MTTPATGVSSTISAGLQVNGNFGLVGTATIGLDSVVGRNLTVAGSATIQDQRILTLVDLNTLNATITALQATVVSLTTQVAGLSSGNGSGTPVAGAEIQVTKSFTLSSVFPLALTSTLPANAVVDNVKLIVDTAFDGTSATASVGISGNVTKYMSTTDNNLTVVGVYEIEPGLLSDSSGEVILISCSPSASTVGAARIMLTYSIPINA